MYTTFSQGSNRTFSHIKKERFSTFSKPLLLALITALSSSALAVQAEPVKTIRDGGNYELEGTTFDKDIADLNVNNLSVPTTTITINKDTHDWLNINKRGSFSIIDIYNGGDTAYDDDPAGNTTVNGNLRITQDASGTSNDTRAISVLAGNQVLTINGDVEISTKGSHGAAEFWGEAIRNVGSEVNLNGNVTVLGADFSSDTAKRLFAEGITTLNQPWGGITKTVTNIGDVNQDHALKLENITATGGVEGVNAFALYAEGVGAEVNVNASTEINGVSATGLNSTKEIIASGITSYASGKINLAKPVTIENITAYGAGSEAYGIFVYPGVVTVGDGLTIRGIQGEKSYSLSAINDSGTDDAVITATNATIVEGDVSSIREPDYTEGKGSEINLGFVGKVKVMVDGEEKEIYKYLKGFSTVDDVSTFKLNLEDGARWEVVTSNPAIQPEGDSYKSVVTKLSLKGGKVYVGSTEKGWNDGVKFTDSLASLTDTDKPVELTIKDLSENGEFYLRTNVHDVSDSIVVTNFITGTFTLNVQPTGEEPPVKQEESYLAKVLNGVAVGDNVFTLGGGKEEDGVQLIDIGVYNYKLENSDRGKGGREWYLVRVDKPQPEVPPQDPDEPPVVPPSNPDTPETPELPVYSPTAEAVLAMAGMGAQSGFYQNQLTDVRKRLGEIRSGVRDGLWASVAGQKDRVSGFAGTRFKQDVYRFNFGADAVVGDWILGGNFKYINADQKTRDTFFKAKGEAHSEGLNLYATWQNEKGCYADFILSADRYHQRINNTMLDGTGVKGTYRNFGLGVSAEIGKKFSLNEAQTWFAEPQLQLSYYHVKGDDFTMSNGMTVKQGNFNSLTGRVGVAAGHEVRTADGKPKGQVYLRTGLKHEFLGKQTLHVNNVKFRDKLVGTRAYYGLATDWNLTKNLKVYGHVERENGSHYTKEIEVMAGVKYSF